MQSKNGVDLVEVRELSIFISLRSGVVKLSADKNKNNSDIVSYQGHLSLQTFFCSFY